MPDKDLTEAQRAHWVACQKLNADVARRGPLESLVQRLRVMREENHFAESFRLYLGGNP